MAQSRPSGRLLPILLASIALAPAHAQPPARGAAATSEGSTAPSLVFEVSTVRPAKPNATGSHSSFNDGRFIASNVTLKSLIQYEAYAAFAVEGGPKWLASQRFDIEAKTSDASVAILSGLRGDPREAQMQHMYQHLLAERFKLKVHWETRELPVYALVLAKGGAALHQTATDGDRGTSISNDQFTANGISMAEMAQALTHEYASELGRVVIDQTGAAGRYDFNFKWTSDTSAASAGEAASSGPSFFTALQEQAELKLQPAKGPVPVLVIDHVEMPSEN